MILFYDSDYRCLKHFYQEKYVGTFVICFLYVVSYNRFVELEKEMVILLALFIKNYCYPVNFFRSNMCKRNILKTMISEIIQLLSIIL